MQSDKELTKRRGRLFSPVNRAEIPAGAEKSHVMGAYIPELKSK